VTLYNFTKEAKDMPLFTCQSPLTFTKLRPLQLLFLSIILTSCSGLSLNEGAVDYRIIPADSSEDLKSKQFVLDKSEVGSIVTSSINSLQADLQVIKGTELRPFTNLKKGLGRISIQTTVNLDKKTNDEFRSILEETIPFVSDELKIQITELIETLAERPNAPDKAEKKMISSKLYTIRKNPNFVKLQALTSLGYDELGNIIKLLQHEGFSKGLTGDLISKACHLNTCAVDKLSIAPVLPFRTKSLSARNRSILKSLLNDHYEAEMSLIAQHRNDPDLYVRYFTSSDGSSYINPGDSITISLVQAYICEFKESSIQDFGLPGWKGLLYRPCDSDDKTRGEILISARVMEKNKSNGLTFNYSDIKNKGRVVYYTEDAREYGQYLNFSNMPVYGPIEYKGRPFYIEFNVIELDTPENDQTRSLLSSLADIGGSAYPPASPILGMLNTLGNSMLNGNRDDLEFRYQLELVPKTKKQNPGIYRPFLREGIYIFIRSEDRSRPIPWSQLSYAPSEGRLKIDYSKCSYKKPKKESCVDEDPLFEDYRDQTYLVMQITKGDASEDLDTAQTVQAFLAVETTDKSYSEDMLKSLKKATSAISNKRSLDRIANAIERY